ncbi:MAG: hypothetical protein Q4P30_03365 [Eubacteriales bacterium]|nr:hypothetical protein [Eubacteriales bacterium]
MKKRCVMFVVAMIPFMVVGCGERAAEKYAEEAAGPEVVIPEKKERLAGVRFEGPKGVRLRFEDGDTVLTLPATMDGAVRGNNPCLLEAEVIEPQRLNLTLKSDGEIVEMDEKLAETDIALETHLRERLDALREPLSRDLFDVASGEKNYEDIKAYFAGDVSQEEAMRSLSCFRSPKVFADKGKESVAFKRMDDLRLYRLDSKDTITAVWTLSIKYQVVDLFFDADEIETYRMTFTVAEDGKPFLTKIRVH